MSDFHDLFNSVKDSTSWSTPNCFNLTVSDNTCDTTGLLHKS